MTPDSHAQRKAKVYEAALALTSQGVSPAAMTIQQLADAAGIGKGTVYEYFSSKEEILQGLGHYCFEQENARVAERFARNHTLTDLENELVDYLQEVAAQRMSTYRLLAVNFGQQAALPEYTNACRSQLTAIVDEMLIRLQAAGEIDPALSLEACRTAMVCTTAGGLVALTCGAGGCYTPPDLPAQLRATLRRVLQPCK